MNRQESAVRNAETFSSRSFRQGIPVLVCLTLLVLFTCDTRAASLFGDLSCKDWASTEHSRKKAWTNAFLAPLSLTIQGLKRADRDPYNDDPNSVEPAILSIDDFCLSHPGEGAAEGAASYISKLTRP